MGLSAQEAEARIRQADRTAQEAEVRVAAIGPAGENRVRFATLSNEGRHAGPGWRRSGVRRQAAQGRRPAGAAPGDSGR